MNRSVRYVTDGLIQRLDLALAEAITAVSDGELTTATVALSFRVTVDDEGLTVTFSHKHGGAHQGAWRPSPQPRLDFGEVEVTAGRAER